MLFVYDYHPLSETLKERHFESRANGITAPFADGKYYCFFSFSEKLITNGFRKFFIIIKFFLIIFLIAKLFCKIAEFRDFYK